MRTMKFLIELISLAGFCVIAACVGDKLVLHFGNVLGLFAGTFALIVLLTALWRAPEGYEDDGGFLIGAGHSQTERRRDVRFAQAIRALKMDMDRLSAAPERCLN